MQPIRNAVDPEFVEYIDDIGNGMDETVSLDLLQHVADEESLCGFVFPQHILNDVTSCVTRCIIAPTNVQVDCYNAVILE